MPSKSWNEVISMQAFVLCLIALHFPQIVGARILWVDQRGNGDFCSIKNAIANMESGDELIIRAGIYQERIVIDSKLNNITIKGMPGVHLRAESLVAPLMEISGGERIKIESLTLSARNPKTEMPIVFIDQSKDISFAANRLNGPGFVGISVQSSVHVELVGNHIMNAGAHAVQASDTTKLSVTKNLLTDTGLLTMNTKEQPKGVIALINVKSAEILQNTIAHNPHSVAIRVRGESSLVARQNIFSFNSDTVVVDKTVELKASDNFSGDPHFVALHKEDYRLRPSSPLAHEGKVLAGAFNVASEIQSSYCPLPKVAGDCHGVVPLGWSNKGHFAYATEYFYGGEAGSGGFSPLSVFVVSPAETTSSPAGIEYLALEKRPTNLASGSPYQYWSEAEGFGEKLRQRGIRCLPMLTCESSPDHLVIVNEAALNGKNIGGIYKRVANHYNRLVTIPLDYWIDQEWAPRIFTQSQSPLSPHRALLGEAPVAVVDNRQEPDAVDICRLDKMAPSQQLSISTRGVNLLDGPYAQANVLTTPAMGSRVNLSGLLTCHRATAAIDGISSPARWMQIILQTGNLAGTIGWVYAPQVRMAETINAVVVDWKTHRIGFATSTGRISIIDVGKPWPGPRPIDKAYEKRFIPIEIAKVDVYVSRMSLSAGGEIVGAVMSFEGLLRSWEISGKNIWDRREFPYLTRSTFDNVGGWLAETKLGDVWVHRPGKDDVRLRARFTNWHWNGLAGEPIASYVTDTKGEPKVVFIDDEKKLKIWRSNQQPDLIVNPAPALTNVAAVVSDTPTTVLVIRHFDSATYVERWNTKRGIRIASKKYDCGCPNVPSLDRDQIYLLDALAPGIALVRNQEKMFIFNFVTNRILKVPYASHSTFNTGISVSNDGKIAFPWTGSRIAVVDLLQNKTLAIFSIQPESSVINP